MRVVPPFARRAPGTGRLHDSAAGDATPIGHDPHGAALVHAGRARERGGGSDAAPSREQVAEMTAGARVAARGVRGCGRCARCLGAAGALGAASANGVISNAPGFHESTSCGEPTWLSPISAVSRASRVETCSGEGCARSNSVHCVTRAGVGSMSTRT